MMDSTVLPPPPLLLVAADRPVTMTVYVV